VIPALPKIEPHFYRGGTVILKNPTEVHIVDNVDYTQNRAFTRPVDAPTYMTTWRSFDAFKFAGE
jgi:hypothetical protein